LEAILDIMGRSRIITYKGKSKFLKDGVGQPCIYCKRLMVRADSDKAYDDPGLVVSVEHKEFPRSKGGDNHPENLAVACKRCNALRGNMAIQLFEPFSRVVIQRFPNAPLPVLREGLRNFIYHCAELSIKNNKGIKAATLATLIDIDKQVKARDLDVK
jgi:hypothetical protein